MKRPEPHCLAAGIGALLLFHLTASAAAPQQANTITLENRSVDQAVVKIVGPVNRTVEVPTNVARTVDVPAGEYYILVQYGAAPGPFSYTRGDTFAVRETADTVSAITITLHRVIGGNYGDRRASREEFDGVKTATPDPPKSTAASVSGLPHNAALPGSESQAKPDFTGRWEIDSSRSTSSMVRGKGAPAGPPRVEIYPELIEHKEPAFKVTNDLSDPQRRIEALTTTDGKEYRQKLTNQQTYVSRTSWEGSQLITEWRLEYDGSPLIEGRDSRTLSADGLVQVVDRHLKFGLGNETSHHVVMVKRSDARPGVPATAARSLRAEITLMDGSKLEAEDIRFVVYTLPADQAQGNRIEPPSSQRPTAPYQRVEISSFMIAERSSSPSSAQAVSLDRLRQIEISWVAATGGEIAPLPTVKYTLNEGNEVTQKPTSYILVSAALPTATVVRRLTLEGVTRSGGERRDVTFMISSTGLVPTMRPRDAVQQVRFLSR